MTNSKLEKWKTLAIAKLLKIYDKYSDNKTVQMHISALASRLEHVSLENLADIMLSMHRIADFYAPEVRTLIPTEEEVIEFFGIKEN